MLRNNLPAETGWRRWSVVVASSWWWSGGGDFAGSLLVVVAGEKGGKLNKDEFHWSGFWFQLLFQLSPLLSVLLLLLLLVVLVLVCCCCCCCNCVVVNSNCVNFLTKLLPSSYWFRWQNLSQVDLSYLLLLLLLRILLILREQRLDNCRRIPCIS